MKNLIRPIYTFAEFSVDVQERQLLKGNEAVALPPKVFDTLMVLVENQGRILEKDVLMEKIWPDSYVEESSLTQYVFQLRKVLGDDAAEHRFIETIPKRGYRFTAQVERSYAEAPAFSDEQYPSLYSTQQTTLGGNSHGHLNLTLNTAKPLLSKVTRLDFFLRPQFINASSRPAAIGNATKWGLGATLVMALVTFIGVGVLLIMQNQQPPEKSPIQITRLTSTGRAIAPAIAPDGKYVAYVADDLGKQSLWIRQVETLSTVQITAPSEVFYQGLTFSPDGNYLFYVVYKMPKHLGVLYRIPILGGTSQKIIEDVDTAVAFSPDGQRIAFVRQYPANLETAIMMAYADGSGEQRLASRRMPKSFAMDGLSWSPDGELIAVASNDIVPDGSVMKLLGIEVRTGREQQLNPQSWGNLKQVAWNKEGCGILAIGWQAESSLVANQVWFIPFPEGEPRRITNDLINYNSLSLARDTGQLVTTQSAKVSRLWLAPGSDAENPTQTPSIDIDYFSEKLGLSWLPNGNLVYGSRASGNADIWTMNPDGSLQKQLTVDSSIDGQPVVSPDGSLIAFMSNRTGKYNIWLMDADGNHQRQLTFGPWDNTPSFSPDGKWVVYNGVVENKPVLWKVPVEGGTPVQLTDQISLRPAVSPDGKLVAHLRLDQQTQRMKLAVVTVDGDYQVRMFDKTIPAPHTVNWSPDGRMLTYVDTYEGVSNLWGLPLDGEAPKALTKFKSDQIFRFAWSPDGKSLACERGFYLNDIVLINNAS